MLRHPALVFKGSKILVTSVWLLWIKERSRTLPRRASCCCHLQERARWRGQRSYRGPSRDAGPAGGARAAAAQLPPAGKGPAASPTLCDWQLTWIPTNLPCVLSLLCIELKPTIALLTHWLPSVSVQPGAEEEQEFNEAVYGQPLQLQQHLVQPTLPAAMPHVQQEPQRRHHGHAPSSGPAGQIQPLNPGQEVPPVSEGQQTAHAALLALPLQAGPALPACQVCYSLRPGLLALHFYHFMPVLPCRRCWTCCAR